MKTKMIFLMLLVPMMIFAQDVIDPLEGTPSWALTVLMPLITLGSTWAIKKLVPLINGSYTLIIVALISGLASYLVTVADNNENWAISFFAGLGAVFFNQFYRSMTESK